MSQLSKSIDERHHELDLLNNRIKQKSIQLDHDEKIFISRKNMFEKELIDSRKELENNKKELIYNQTIVEQEKIKLSREKMLLIRDKDALEIDKEKVKQDRQNIEKIEKNIINERINRQSDMEILNKDRINLENLIEKNAKIDKNNKDISIDLKLKATKIKMEQEKLKK